MYFERDENDRRPVPTMNWKQYKEFVLHHERLTKPVCVALPSSSELPFIGTFLSSRRISLNTPSQSHECLPKRDQRTTPANLIIWRRKQTKKLGHPLANRARKSLRKPSDAGLGNLAPSMLSGVRNHGKDKEEVSEADSWLGHLPCSTNLCKHWDAKRWRSY